MKTKIIILVLISTCFTMCNLTFLKNKDYKFKENDFIWHTQIKGQPGCINIKDQNILFGMNCYATFLKVSPVNGDILDTLKPFTVDNEIGYHRVFTIPVDK